MVAVEPRTDEDECGQLLADLVAIDSQNPPGKERECAEFIHSRLRDWGLDSRLVSAPFDDRPQVVATVGNEDSSAGTLVLNGHIDVVPPGDRTDWSVDPFEGVVRDGKVYGRGASDMKAGIAAAMLAGRAAAASDAFDGHLVLTFAVGEETAEPGTKTLLEDVEGDYGVVLEPTELQVQTAGKGLAWYDISIHGDACHASRPHLGRNVLAGLLSMNGAIAEYQEEISERVHPLLGKSLCTPTVADVGGKENVIPGRGHITFDRRFLPSEDITTIDTEMSDLFDPLRDDGFEVTVERTRTYEAAEIPVDAEIAEVFRDHSVEISGVDPSPAGKDAATDQRNFVNDAEIPAIIWGPGSPSQSHTVDEWARTDLLYQSVEILCQGMTDLCS